MSERGRALDAAPRASSASTPGPEDRRLLVLSKGLLQTGGVQSRPSSGVAPPRALAEGVPLRLRWSPVMVGRMSGAVRPPTSCSPVSQNHHSSSVAESCPTPSVPQVSCIAPPAIYSRLRPESPPSKLSSAAGSRRDIPLPLTWLAFPTRVAPIRLASPLSVCSSNACTRGEVESGLLSTTVWHRVAASRSVSVT